MYCCIIAEVIKYEEFDKSDEDEDYMPKPAQATTQPQGDDVVEEENEVTMIG
jgi:hypothetical protein